MRTNCSSDQEKLLKFQAKGREFPRFLRSQEKFIQTAKVQNNILPKTGNSNFEVK